MDKPTYTLDFYKIGAVNAMFKLEEGFAKNLKKDDIIFFNETSVYDEKLFFLKDVNTDKETKEELADLWAVVICREVWIDNGEMKINFVLDDMHEEDGKHIKPQYRILRADDTF